MLWSRMGEKHFILKHTLPLRNNICRVYCPSEVHEQNTHTSNFLKRVPEITTCVAVDHVGCIGFSCPDGVTGDPVSTRPLLPFRTDWLTDRL